MIPRQIWALGGIGTVLAGIVALQLGGLVVRGNVADESPMNPSSLRRPVQAAAAPAPSDGRKAWAETVLARPLFTAGRRPVAGPVAAPVAPASLPRLSGVMVSGANRSAIFAGAGGGRPTVAVVGGRVGGWTIQSIEAGSVTLSGPDGTQVLRPAFDARRDAGRDVRRDTGRDTGRDTRLDLGRDTALGTFNPAPFAAATEVMPSLRDLPGFSGPSAR